MSRVNPFDATITHAKAPTPRAGSLSALWASAFVIMALIVAEGSRRGIGTAAYAGDAATVADLTVLTLAAGPDEDVLCVLDQRNETLSVFGIEQGRAVQLFQQVDLAPVFVQARAGSAGR